LGEEGNEVEGEEVTMLRATAASVLDGLGAFRTLLRVRGIARSPWVTVLTYHRVGDPVRNGDLDRGVVDARPDQFDAQLGFIRECCSVIDLDQLRAFVGGEPLPPNPVLITFDDGYRDNYDVALPLLKKHGIRAVFFIATDFITERRLFWWDRASLILRRSKREQIELTYPSKRRVVLGNDDATHARALRSVLAPVKSHFGVDVQRYLEQLEKATDVVVSAEEERKLADEHLLDWDQIKQMHAAGMSIESHTRTHRILGTLDDRALEEELGGAREVIEGKLGHQVTAVAYPVGKGLACAPMARRAIRRAGYELGFSNGTGLNTTLRFDSLDVRRLSMEVDLPEAYFRGMVALPYFAYEPHGDSGRSDITY
jgi:peptidoglycan/xylan/chitin deacetylase (PgdA/CDA1 family)